MEKQDFAHLHLHTEYSLLDGAVRIDRLFCRAKELGQTSVAITDHGVMYGAVQFYKAAKKEGIHPVIGCEVYVAPRKLTDKELQDREYYHLVLLCENMTGYENLMTLVSTSFTEGFYQKPRVDMELLQKHSEGLIALSACLAGKIPQLILAGNLDGAKTEAKKLSEIFGKDNFYLELQDHNIPDQLRVNSALVSISRELGLPLVATNDVHYLNREDAKSHDILLCIQTGKTLQDEDRMRFETEEFYLKSTEEMAALFPKYPEAITNSSKIAKRCQVDFDFSSAHLPRFQTPSGLSSAKYLEKLCREGLKKRIAENGIGESVPYEKRLAYELETVEKMGFCDYFLIVADFVSFAKKSGIYVGPGRGSGAGSLAAWCLDITELDPLKNQLIFERFLNPERVSMPDFDIDFCMDRRHEVIEYVTEKYGKEHVAQIVTFSTMAARAAVRDVGRVMGMPYGDVDKIVKKIPRFLNMTLDKALADDKGLKTMCQSGQEKELMDIARSLEGMPRNASIHAAGVVLTDKPVKNYVPLATSGGIKVTQFTMNELADLGLLKIDFLGLRYLTIIRDAVEEVRRSNPEFDIHAIPLDDKETFEMISRGETAGMFQIESSGMKALMLQMKPEHLEDITAAIALYRPGPKDSIPRFLENRRNGVTGHKVREIDDIVSYTHGCIVYQEQVMEIFRKLAGYSFGRADIVRKAMSKKKRDVLEKEREVFLYGSKKDNGTVECEGALARGISQESADAIWSEMDKFAEYAFNKSHAAAYALLSYRTAYLKCKYPKEYMAAILTSQLDSEKYAYYFSECQRMGIAILPPDINESRLSFSVSQNALRFGLVGVKNVGEGLIQHIFCERSKAPFSSFRDFAERMRPHGLNKKALESLILSGAMDAFGISRSKLLAVADSTLSSVGMAQRSVMSGQISLFDAMGDHGIQAKEEEFPDIPDFTEKERLRGEKAACGVYFSGHPLKNMSHLAQKIGAVDILSFRTDAETFRDGDKVALLCLVSHVTLKQVRSGGKMAFVQAEDRTGMCEVIVFPKVLSRVAPLLEEDRIVAIFGTVNTKDEEIKVLADEILSEADAKSRTPIVKKEQKETGEIRKNILNFQSVSKIFLRFSTKESKMEKRVVALLRIFPGNTPCLFYYQDSEKLFRADALSVQLSPTVYRELIRLLGEENVVLK